MDIRRTNGLLASDRQTGRQNDGHALCVVLSHQGGRVEFGADKICFGRPIKKTQTPRKSLAPGIARVLKRLHYPLEVMLLCVRWYVAYSLSLRNLEEMMGYEQGRAFILCRA
jgi:hypothetical protein